MKECLKECERVCEGGLKNVTGWIEDVGFRVCAREYERVY